MKKHLLTNLEVGESRGIVRNYENGQVSVISIHSTKHVTFCSNFFGHENQKNSKSKLRIQQFYQDYMGGVDWFNSRINSLKFKHLLDEPKKRTFILLFVDFNGKSYHNLQSSTTNKDLLPSLHESDIICLDQIRFRQKIFNIY